MSTDSLFCDAEQVKRAEKHLLEALYGHISSLGKFESDTLLEEDPDIMQRRAATKKVNQFLLWPPRPSRRLATAAVGAASWDRGSCYHAQKPQDFFQTSYVKAIMAPLMVDALLHIDSNKLLMVMAGFAGHDIAHARSAGVTEQRSL